MGKKKAKAKPEPSDKRKLVKRLALEPIAAQPLLHWVDTPRPYGDNVLRCYLGKVSIGTVNRSMMRGEYVWRSRLPGAGAQLADGSIGGMCASEAECMAAVEAQIRDVLVRLFPVPAVVTSVSEPAS